jgi:mannosyl-oligosaccharide alpha-1,3-glucosidase
MMSSTPLRIGYVPEHYLLPLHLARPHFPFPVELIPFPSGTGHMITSLRSDSIDLAIGLTEGWVAGLLTAQGQKEKGYSIVGSWVKNPLRWAIVTGRNRSDINSVEDLRQHRRVGVSRLGSGSHVMAFVLAQQEGWLKDSKLEIVPLGPFKDLRDGVTGATADFFMWEHFTTKPYFHGDGTPLKNIGEIYTPWPSWHIAASANTFPEPEGDEKLRQVFETLDQGVKEFKSNIDEGVKLLGTGELGCHYTEEDAREWLKTVEFYENTKGVDAGVMDGVVKVLQGADVIESSTEVESGNGVIGIKR